MKPEDVQCTNVKDNPSESNTDDSSPKKIKQKKGLLKLQLGRTFSSGSLKKSRSPGLSYSEQNSPMSLPSSPRGSPNHGSPVFQKPKSRSPWYNFTQHRSNRSTSSLSNSSTTTSSRWYGEGSLPQSPISPIEYYDREKSGKESFTYEKTKSRSSWASIGGSRRTSSSLSNSPVRQSPGSGSRGSSGSVPYSPMTPKQIDDLKKVFADHKSKSKHSLYTSAKSHRHRSFTSLPNSTSGSSKYYPNNSSPPSPSYPIIRKSATFTRSFAEDQLWMKYSPQQQQKERKSESDLASVQGTPARELRNSAQISQQNLSSRSAGSMGTSSSSGSSGVFAWTRVFRFASMLHQIGC